MADFVSKIDLAIRERCSVHSGANVLVTLSGGADSVALLDALVGLGYKCIAAHCNFHLRGEESNRDCQYAMDFAKTLGVEIYVKDFDVKAYEKRFGVSTEMACRELRYEWFEQLRKETKSEVIAVAHHRDDNIETFFLNLLRGTGISGLTGMAYRNGKIVRPMLDCTRAEIELYLKNREIGYVTDSTNLQNDFKRNRLRNVILPLLNDQFPGASDAIATTIAHLRENELIYSSAVSDAERKYKEGDFIDVLALVKNEQGADTLLFEMLRPYGFNFTHIKDIVASKGESGRRFYADNYIALLDRGRLFISSHDNSNETECELEVNLTESFLSPINLNISLIEKCDVCCLKANQNKVFFDAEILSGNPVFKLRHWSQGDRLAPYGMNGTKKLSDIFSDAKLSLDEKSKVWILTRNEEILWVVGMRASRHFAVKESTKRVLQIEFLP